MPVIRKQFDLGRGQHEFCRSPALYRAIVGGIGSGKSKAGAYDLIRRSQPGCHYMALAPIYRTLQQSTLISFKEVADELGVLQKINREQATLKTGANVWFRSTHIPDNLRGPNLSGLWLDEASLMHEQAYLISIGRLREHSGLGWMTATFTPKGKKHWTYKRFGTGDVSNRNGVTVWCNGKTECFHIPTKSNPFLHEEFYGTIRSEYTSEQAEQELEGAFIEGGIGHFHPRSWPTWEGTGGGYRLYPQRELVLHQDFKAVILVLDIATKEKNTSDYTAFIVAGLTRDNRLLILDVINRRMAIEKLGETLDGLCQFWRPDVVTGEDDNVSLAMQLEWRRWPNIPEVNCLPIAGRAKIVRAQPAMIHGENRRIYLPMNAPWKDDFCDQLEAFTGVKPDRSQGDSDTIEHDDMVDCVGILVREANRIAPREAPKYDVLPSVLIAGRQIW